MQKTDICCLHSHKLTWSNKHKDKNFKTKKTHSSPFAIQDNNENGSQLGQALSHVKRDSGLNRKDQWGLFSNTLIIDGNVTVVQKNKKKSDKDLSQVKYYSCHKMSYYANKCLNKDPKTNIGLGNFHINNCS